MKELNEIISDYLQAKDTDYALMINGDWGCGKTYYLNHDFKEFVKEQFCPFDPDMYGQIKKGIKDIGNGVPSDYKYFPAFISLYGISSADDFQYRVFLGVNTWAKNKFVGAMAAMGSKVADIIGLSLEKKDTNKLTVISNNTVLVFDDLERICSDKISAKEVLGLINEYSEHNHYKVIIVCNEDVYEGKLDGLNRDEEYWRYKEKTIRYTYRFEADVPKVYDTIVNTFNNTDLKQYLEQNKSFILNLFDLGGKKNLRTLKYYLDSLSKIFVNVTDVKYKKQILKTLCVSTMIYATEYKNGKRKEDLEELKATYDIDLGDDIFGIQNREQEEREPSYSEEVAKIYGTLYQDEMDKLPFVIDYLISGYLDKQVLCEWVDERNNDLVNAEDKPEYKIYRELDSFATIEDNKLIEKLNLMIQYAKEDKYKVIDLMQVYALLVKYHCIGAEGFSLTDEIDKIFINAIDKHKDDWKYLPNMEYKIPIWDGKEKGQESYQKYDVMKKHVLQMNYQSRLAKEKAGYDDFLRKAEGGDVEGIRHYREKNENRIPLGGIDWSRVCKVLDTGSNPIACEVATCLKYLIPDSSFIHPEDLKPLKEELQPWLDNYVQKEDKRVRRLFILDLKRHIDSIIRSY